MTRYTPMKLATVIGAGLMAVGGASAQTAGTMYSYISSPGAAQTAALGGIGNFNQTLVASGFASESYGYLNGSTASDDVVQTSATTTGTQNGGVLGAGNGNNVTASGFDLGSFALQGAPGTDGSIETVTSVTLLLYVDSASVTAPDPVVSIYAGLNNATGVNPLGSYTVGAAQVGSYITIDIPYSVAFSGFTLADLVRRNPQDGVNYGTEDNTTLNFQPAYRVNTTYILPVPEPSVAVLGGVAALMLFRRRRA